MKKQNKGNFVIRSAASLVREVAHSNANAACFMFVNQPKEPANMTMRLQAMKETANEHRS